MTATWQAALAALDTPPGAPGSGRQRYGAAMTLWREGLILPSVLEIYRVASPLDAQDPVPMLAEAGLPRPGTEIAALVEAVAACLARLSGAGLAEVRAGLAAAQSVAPSPRPNPVVAAQLPAALHAMAPAAPFAAALAAPIRAAAPWLGWVTYDSYPADAIGPDFPTAHAFAPLAAGDDYELGLFLIAPGVLYRDRAHAAPELYLPLTGPHLWRMSPGAAMLPKPAGEPVWNPPHQPHATRTGAVPFLCLYAWTRDIGAPAYVLPAPDWAELEART